MLTLIRGKARKSEYMQLLHKGTNNSVMVLYGHDIPVSISEEKEVLIYDRSSKTYNSLLDLEFELLELVAQLIENTNYKYLYIYGNFEPSEIAVLEKIAHNPDVKPALSICATIQDGSIPDGQIIIEERR
jgi:hypothetical protein